MTGSLHGDNEIINPNHWMCELPVDFLPVGTLDIKNRSAQQIEGSQVACKNKTHPTYTIPRRFM